MTKVVNEMMIRFIIKHNHQHYILALKINEQLVSFMALITL